MAPFPELILPSRVAVAILSQKIEYSRNRKRFVPKYIYIVARIVMGVLFLWAAWGKLMDPEAFAAVIERYQLLPMPWINILALVLPMLEAVCGLFLIVNQMTKGAMLIVILLLTVFMGALGASLVRGLDINCGCFSLSDTSRFSLVRGLLQDVLMLFVAVWIFLLQLNWIHRPKTRESGSG